MFPRLIDAPSVILVAQPQLVVGGIHQFAEEQGLSHLADNPDTPLGRIADISCDWGKGYDIHNDGEVLVEFGGRQCYGAWEQGRDLPAYMNNIMSMGHGSVLAHAHWSFVITGISRSMSLELVRHSAGTDISQESQRFVDASTVKVVAPPALLHAWGGDLECDAAKQFFEESLRQVHAYNRVQAEIQALEEDFEAMPLEPFVEKVTKFATEEERIEKAKKKRLTLLQKRANETARALLPNACETKMLWTANARALRHIIALRGAPDADLEIRRFAAELARVCKTMAPAIFADVEITDGDFSTPVTTTQYYKV